MVGVFLQHLEECQARAIVVVPDHKQYWFSRMASATQKSKILSVCRGDSPFFRVHHQRGPERFHFKRWGMLAVALDFARDE